MLRDRLRSLEADGEAVARFAALFPSFAVVPNRAAGRGTRRQETFPSDFKSRHGRRHCDGLSLRRLNLALLEACRRFPGCAPSTPRTTRAVTCWTA